MICRQKSEHSSPSIGWCHLAVSGVGSVCRVMTVRAGPTAAASRAITWGLCPHRAFTLRRRTPPTCVCALPEKPPHSPQEHALGTLCAQAITSRLLRSIRATLGVAQGKDFLPVLTFPAGCRSGFCALPHPADRELAVCCTVAPWQPSRRSVNCREGSWLLSSLRPKRVGASGCFK